MKSFLETEADCEEQYNAIQKIKTYMDYSVWIQRNWNESKSLDQLIIKEGLMHEKINDTVGEPYRFLNKEQFEDYTKIKK